MPDFIATVILSKNGKPYHPGDTINLTKEQADNLGPKVVPASVVDPDKPIADMGLKELKVLAADAGVEGYSRKSKKELVEILTGVREEAGVTEPAPEPEQVVVDDGTESDSGS